ncbi:MAG: hypothetical protein ABSC94_26835 [Polyangiaceae bacterium]
MLGQAFHHVIGILESDLVEPKATQNRLNVKPQQAFVVIRGCFGRHVIRAAASEFAARPQLAELGEGGYMRVLLPGPARAKSIHGSKDGLPSASRTRPSSNLHHRLDFVTVTGATQSSGHRGERLASFDRFAFRRAHRQEEILSCASAQRDARCEALGKPAKFSCCLCRHR